MIESENAGEKKAAGKTGVRIALGLILLTGLLVRVSGLPNESIWWDEFTSVVHLQPPVEWQSSPQFDRWNQMVIRQTCSSLFDFWKQNRTMDPATMPLYYTLEYGWNKYIGTSFLSLRLLSILIGLLSIPVLYRLGRDLFGSTAGLVAAMCIALSPIHRQFSQEIRMYGLMTLLAALSVYTFFHLVQDKKRRWWAAHAAVNLLLFWTHPFALLVPFVEGVFWFFFYPRDILRVFRWGILQGLLVVPSAVYMATIRFWSQDSTGNWMRLPTATEFLGDLFGDDAIGLTYQLRAEAGFWGRIFPADTAQWLVAQRWLIGRWMVALFLLGLAWLLIASLWRAARPANGKPANWRWAFFLAIWWLLPPVVLLVVSVTWRPCIMPRYTLPSSLALYLILGGAVGALPRRLPKLLAAAVIAGFFLYQQSLVLGAPQHTDWRSSAAYIRAEAKFDDLVLTHNWLWKRVFVYNLGPVPNVVSYGSTYDILAEECAFFLDLNLPSQAVPGETRRPWAVIKTDYFESGGCADFERELEKRGISFELAEFGGLQHILVYRVFRKPGAAPPSTGDFPLHEDGPKEFGDLALEFWRAQQYDPAIAACKKAIEINSTYARAYSYLGMVYKDAGDTQNALLAFQTAVSLNPMDYPWSHINIAMILTEQGQYDEAIRELEFALTILPNDAWAHTCLGRAYLGKGDRPAAIAAFEKAVALDPNDQRGQVGLEEARRAQDTGSTPG